MSVDARSFRYVRVASLPVTHTVTRMAVERTGRLYRDGVSVNSWVAQASPPL